MEKLLTIIVPTYNMEKYLRRCLGSLIMDEARMILLEVLVINDGSKDSSSSIAHEYQAKYPDTFRVIDKENGGHGSCCNVGLREAKGKYIRFLDSDDWFDQENFPRFIDLLQTLDVDLVQTNRILEYVKENRSVTCNIYEEVAEQEYMAEEFPYSKFKNFFSTIHDSSYRTEMLRNINIVFSEKIQFDDTVLYIKPFEGIKTIYCSNMVIYHYMLGREGQSVGNIDERKMQFRKQEFLKLCDEYSEIRNGFNDSQRMYFDKTINSQTLQEYYYYSLYLPFSKCVDYTRDWDDRLKVYDFVNYKSIPIKRKYGFIRIEMLKLIFNLYNYCFNKMRKLF